MHAAVLALLSLFLACHGWRLQTLSDTGSNDELSRKPLRQEGWRKQHYPIFAAQLLALHGIASQSSARSSQLPRARTPFAGKMTEDIENRKRSVEIKKLRAESLRLLAQKAELEAEQLSLEARNLTLQHVNPLSTQEELEMVSSSSKEPVLDTEVLSKLQVLLKQEGLECLDSLQQIIAKAWEAGRLAQQNEIKTLRHQVEYYVERESEQTSTSENDFQSFQIGFQDAFSNLKNAFAKNDLQMLSSLESMHGRALTRATFEYFGALQQAKEDSQDAILNHVYLSTARARLKNLEQHEMAQCVEYRSFAQELSKAEELTEFARRLPFYAADLREALSTNVIPKSGWLQRFQDLHQRDQENDAATFGMIVAPLASDDSNLEMIVVYYVARVLACLNIQTIARYEGRMVPSQCDQIVARLEDRDLQLEEIVKVSIVKFVLQFGILWAVAGAFLGQDVATLQPDPLSF